MTTNPNIVDDGQVDPDEESEVIKELRKQVKTLKADRKQLTTDSEQALATARAQVKREAEALSLMSNAGFDGLADIFATEVDGDLTVATAAEWLKVRGLEASPGTLEEENATSGEPDVGDVADLGAQVAAATQDQSGASFLKKVDALEAEATSVDDYFKQLETLAAS